MSAFVYAASFCPSGNSDGVYGFRWLAGRRRLETIGVAGNGVENPLCLETDPTNRHLYVGDCRARWQNGGSISAYGINPVTGELDPRNSVASAGVIPVFLQVTSDGRNILAANCGPFAAGCEGRTVAVFPLKKHGHLGPAKTIHQHEGTSVDPERQTSPHPHCIAVDPASQYVWVPDLGTDSIWCYAYDESLGALLHQPQRTVHVPANSGPRLLKFHPNGNFAYLINEIASTVIVYRYRAGKLDELQTLAVLPGDLEERNASDLIIHPNGCYLYTTNRSQDCISVFDIDCETGIASLRGQIRTQGKAPRGIALDRRGRFLLAGNEGAGTVQGFQILEDGALTDLGVLAEMPGPACLKFVEF